MQIEDTRSPRAPYFYSCKKFVARTVCSGVDEARNFLAGALMFITREVHFEFLECNLRKHLIRRRKVIVRNKINPTSAQENFQSGIDTLPRRIEAGGNRCSSKTDNLLSASYDTGKPQILAARIREICVPRELFPLLRPRGELPPSEL